MISKYSSTIKSPKYSLALIVAGMVCLAACRPGSSPSDRIAVEQDTVVAASSDPASKNVGNNVQKESRSRTKEVRNVILIIGDGMGPQQMGLLMEYAHNAPHSVVPERMAAMERMTHEGTIGLVRTEPYDAIVADSAASATQLATGQYARSEMIGVNKDGNAAESVVEIAHSLGKSTGLITDTRVTHATPAAFAAHQPHRTSENEIAVDMLNNHVDVLLGGGLQYWIPMDANNKDSATYESLVQMVGGRYPVISKREDNRSLLVEARASYQLVFDRKSLDRLSGGRVLGLFAESSMNDALMEAAELELPQRTQPTLVEMVSKSLELLEQNPKGFFLMVEGGQIDWAAHNNDAGTLLHEMLRLDAAVRYIHDWASRRDDTLVLVTADHETGAFGFSYSGNRLPPPRHLPGKIFQGRDFQPAFNFGDPSLLDKLYAQKKSFFQIFTEFDALPTEKRTAEKLKELVNGSMPFQITLDDALEILSRERNRLYVRGHEYLGSRTVPQIRDFPQFFVYGENGRMNLLGRVLADQQNVVWGTGTHTNTPVVLIAYGPSYVTSWFGGFLHMTEVGQRMIDVVRGKATQTSANGVPRRMTQATDD